MNNSTLFWLTALGVLLLVLPGFNLIGAVLLAIPAATVAERTLGPSKGYKELR